MVDCSPQSPFWCYLPNQAAPIAFAVLYFICAVGHIYQALKYRAKYCIPLVVGASLTTAGFVIKAWSSRNTTNLIGWIVAQCLLFVAPPIYAAADYFILAKTMYYVPGSAPMHPGRVVTTFVAADGLCELLNSVGIGRVVSIYSPTQVVVGQALIKAGLLLQVILFAGFIFVVVKFHRNVIRDGVAGRWTAVLWVLYASSLLISVRCIYRIVEFFEGITGEIYRNEVYFHIFEAALMFLNVAILDIWHPGRYLPQSSNVYINKEGVEVEEERAGWEDNRHFLLTLFDPFDIGGIIRRRREKAKLATANEKSAPAEGQTENV